MTMSQTYTVIFLSLLLTSYASHAYQAPEADTIPLIDGSPNDPAWSQASWANIDQLMLGTQPSPEDFSGRYKLVWSGTQLFILAEITDDVLIDTHADPLHQYWEDDTLEIFLDEDKSGGNHLDNYNAFAYHIALDNQTVDLNMKGKPRLLNEHVTSQWKRSTDGTNKVIWEASLQIYPDTFTDQGNTVKPVLLTAGKKIGFMVAYCDSDGNDGRQHFVGSHDITAVNGDKNRGYIDASVFDTLELIK